MKKPFRVGRKSKRSVLDADGLEVVTFDKGKEGFAIIFCQCLNELDQQDLEQISNPNSQYMTGFFEGYQMAEKHISKFK